jgi:hypothetical protein
LRRRKLSRSAAFNRSARAASFFVFMMRDPSSPGLSGALPHAHTGCKAGMLEPSLNRFQIRLYLTTDGAAKDARKETPSI